MAEPGVDGIVIPGVAVKAAAKALCAEQGADYSKLSALDGYRILESAMAALNAAAPLIVAAAFAEAGEHNQAQDPMPEDSDHTVGFRSGVAWFKNNLRTRAQELMEAATE